MLLNKIEIYKIITNKIRNKINKTNTGSIDKTLNLLTRITSYNVCYTKLLRVGACLSVLFESVFRHYQLF